MPCSAAASSPRRRPRGCRSASSSRAAPAEAAAQVGQARATAARRSPGAPLDAAEARAAAAQAITAMEAEAATASVPEELARDAGRALDGEHRAAGQPGSPKQNRPSRSPAASVTPPWPQPRQPALTPPASAEQDQQRHDAALAAPAAQLAAANDTIAALRDQLTRDQAALDRERAGQHAHRPAARHLHPQASRAASNGGQHPQADDGTGHQPAAAGGNGTSRRHAPPRVPAAAPQRPGHPRRAAAPAPPARPTGGQRTPDDPGGPGQPPTSNGTCAASKNFGQLLATLPDRLTPRRQNKFPHADFLELLLPTRSPAGERPGRPPRPRRRPRPGHAAGHLGPVRRRPLRPAAVERAGRPCTVAEAAHGALVLGHRRGRASPPGHRAGPHRRPPPPHRPRGHLHGHLFDASKPPGWTTAPKPAPPPRPLNLLIIDDFRAPAAGRDRHHRLLRADRRPAPP